MKSPLQLFLAILAVATSPNLRIGVFGSQPLASCPPGNYAFVIPPTPIPIFPPSPIPPIYPAYPFTPSSPPSPLSLPDTTLNSPYLYRCLPCPSGNMSMNTSVLECASNTTFAVIARLRMTGESVISFSTNQTKQDSFIRAISSLMQINTKDVEIVNYEDVEALPAGGRRYNRHNLKRKLLGASAGNVTVLQITFQIVGYQVSFADGAANMVSQLNAVVKSEELWAQLVAEGFPNTISIVGLDVTSGTRIQTLMTATPPLQPQIKSQTQIQSPVVNEGSASNNLAIGLGVGLGVGLTVVVAAIVAFFIWRMRSSQIGPAI